MHAINTDQGVCTPPQHFLDSALELAQLGIRVHPLKPGTKEPCFTDYQHLATTDAALIRSWWTKRPDANVGLIPGVRSGLFALDIDRRHHGHESLAALEGEYGELPVTWQTTSGDGFHIFFRYPTIGQIASGKPAPGIDLISDGGNLVAPGSIHPTGHVYHWSEFYHPDMVPLADPPRWLMALLQAKGLYREGSDEPVAQGKASMGTPPRDPNVILAFSALDHTDKGVPGSLDGAAVKALYGQWDVVERCLRVLGLGDVKPGVKFHCIVHPDEHSSAAILPPRSPDEQFIYTDFHHREDEPYLIPLPLLFYCKVTGASTATRLPAPSFQVWALRLLAAAGVIAGVPMQAPKLKGYVPQDARRVYGGFVELLSLKWLHTPKAPSPLSWRFAEAWLGGMPQAAVARAIGWLLGRGYLRAVAQEGKLYHFLFGTRALINRRSRRRYVPETKQEDITKDVAKDVDAMLAPADGACPDCGADRSWIKSDGSCEWCVALDAQRRLLEIRARAAPPVLVSG